MSNIPQINHVIDGDKVVVNGVVNLQLVKPIMRSDAVGIFCHKRTGTILVTHYKDKQMIKCDESSASK
jgi:hypothetical protein